MSKSPISLYTETRPKPNFERVSVYFHIPFCTRKCAYCHFYVIPEKEESKQQLVEGFQKEWRLRLPQLQGKEIVSIYFGGGTPSLLGASFIAQILDWIYKDANIITHPEITLEANPENITLQAMQQYAQAGINRLSIGIQTFNDKLLNILTRTHDAEKAIQSVYLAEKAGLENISIDLMYDLPGQTLADWQHTLMQASSLPITHLSLYNMTIEPTALFFKHQTAIRAMMPDEDTSLAMYELAIDTLQKAGLNQYEISAFAKGDHMSRHNLGYWLGRPFLGFGPSAFSYWEGARFRNIANLNTYSRILNEGSFPVDFEERLSLDAARRELFVIALRTCAGVHLANFQEQHGDLDAQFLTTLDKLQQEGLIQYRNNCLCLTRRGILLYDAIASELI